MKAAEGWVYKPVAPSERKKGNEIFVFFSHLFFLARGKTQRARLSAIVFTFGSALFSNVCSV